MSPRPAWTLARIEIREILNELRNMGKTILLSSHILSELSEVCNRIAILERGEMVAQGELSEIMDSARDDTEVWLHTTDDERACVVLRELPQIASAELDERKTPSGQLEESMDLAAISGHLHNRELGVRYLERQDPSLEEVFMKLTKGLVQ